MKGTNIFVSDWMPDESEAATKAQVTNDLIADIDRRECERIYRILFENPSGAFKYGDNSNEEKGGEVALDLDDNNREVNDQVPSATTEPLSATNAENVALVSVSVTPVTNKGGLWDTELYMQLVSAKLCTLHCQLAAHSSALWESERLFLIWMDFVALQIGRVVMMGLLFLCVVYYLPV